ncbi:peptidoglycan bridge formation glycyltransferase FemA/FemB family protein [Patescibacteria group bacterium]|nr:peptidoglycan bridge formation glycyltransferase FemA/FemB family protein [Patescibacteria group bacterium]
MIKYHYIKQSKPWGEYLSELGWKCFYTKDNVGVYVLKTIFGGLAKVQRPYVLDVKVLDEIEVICKENRAVLVKVEPNLQQNGKLLLERGYKLSPTPLSPSKSMYMDLGKSLDGLWRNLSRSGKYGVNRALREGTTISCFKYPKEEMLQEYCEILKQTERRGKFVSQNSKEIRILTEVFREKAYLFFAYTSKGALAGAKFFLGDEKVITYLNGATSRAGLECKAGYALFWEAVRYFKQNEDYKLMDLEGCYDARYPLFTKNWEGFTEFKMKFGPEVVEFPGAYVKYFSPIFKVFLGRL